MKKLLGAYAVGVGIFYVGVTYFFEPAMAGDLPEGPMLPNPGALLVGFALQVWFYDWVAQQVGDPMKAAMVVAVPQILLVDVNYVLNGTRQVEAALISAVLISAGWFAVGKVYGMLSEGGSAEGS